MPADTVLVRAAAPRDLDAVAAIQADCPQAAQWNVRDYLEHDFLVAERGERVVGFAVARPLGEGEAEILNLAVAPEFRRRGVARGLFEALQKRRSGHLYLEVRESNQEARKFYQMLGFQEVGRRDGYYDQPPEAAIVMKFLSCYCHK
ncbi:MAG TPA: ribosomal protein S18-alanine N-acetyltransferase [Bryobacteraceae bacterium]|nr:ribosomal protein S18-alanine N-acetyltransferase [Bryobacteraceae bacterium]